MPAAIRIGDFTSHIPNPSPVPQPAGTGEVTGPPMASNVLIGGAPAAVGTALCACADPFHVPPGPLVPPINPLITLPLPGKTVLINNMPAAMKGDNLSCGATVVGGCPTVKIGGD
ncbi:PAAR domain-containing protein [Streptomyces noursei]